MDSKTALPRDLVKALNLLEERFALLGARTRRVAEAEWGSVDPGVRGLIPDWLGELLGSMGQADLATTAREVRVNRKIPRVVER